MSRNNESYKITKIFSHLNRLDVISAIIGGFVGISIISFIALNYNSAFLIASFGASAVILYVTPQSPFARIKNVAGGHLIAAVVGVTMYNLFGLQWWSLSLAVTISITLMMLTDTIHPPAGATSLIAVLTKATHMFIFMPVLTGVIILLLWATILNRLREKARNSKDKVA